MQSMIKVGNSEIAVKEYMGKRVVTFKDIDMVHNRPEGTAKRAFSQHRKHLMENEDFYRLNQKEVNGTNFVQLSSPNGLTLVTESGYLMLVKSFTDDLAWEVQRNLVNNYFRTSDLNQVIATFLATQNKMIEVLQDMNKRLSVLEDRHDQKVIKENFVGAGILKLYNASSSSIVITGTMDIMDTRVPVIQDHNGHRLMLVKTIADIHRKANPHRITDYIKRGIVSGRYTKGDYINVKGNVAAERLLINNGILSEKGIYRAVNIFLLYESGYRKIMQRAYTGHAIDQYPYVIKSYFQQI